MSGKHQGLRYFQKFLNSKVSERNALAKKVLRCVLAVGFVLSPWLGGEAYAAGIERVDDLKLPSNSEVKQTYFNGSDGNVAHIYAEQASGDVGLNRFKTFNVADGQIANMHFKTSSTGATLNYLVNTVEGEINISGTVNAIRNNKIGGNLYFMSPEGMVVGSTGVINAGSLTVLANNDTFTTAEGAHYAIYEAVKDYQYWKSPNIDSYITINGKINTETGIDLRAAVVQIKKATSNSVSPSFNSVSPSLLTGVVFNEVVNTDTYDNIQIYPINEKRLTLTNENGKIVIKNPTTLEEITSDGNGKINIYARNFNVGSFIGTFALNHGSIDAVGELRMDVGTSITVDSNTSIKANQITILNHSDNVVNNGTITGSDAVSIAAGNTNYKELSSINNGGTIESEAGTMSLTATNSFTNTGTIQADGQIKFAVGGTLTNQGTIESTSSNVQAHIGRNFQNLAVPDPSDSSILKGGIIEAGGNVQVDYNLDNEGIGVATEAGTIDGIYNSGLIWAKGDKDPVYDEAGNISSSGSGNIWLTSAYNITNDGTMKANRQITLNARDFLHNYGLIEGVTYLEIKSIMGYVYNHGFEEDGTEMAQPGRIIATGGNIDLSSGQENLVIENDEDGTKKELYRKFTPIIIEGSVEATSALNNTTSETNQGNINIRAYLGDIYVNGGTIEAKAGPNGEVKSVAGNVTLDAAQNITIGFETVKAWADDPTTEDTDGYHPEYVSDTERGYYKPISDSNSVPSSPCQKPATISGSDITLKSGSDENYNIFMSNTTTVSDTTTVSNTLTASNAINIDTASMNIIGGTLNASTLNATGELTLTGGTVTSDGDLTISGANGLTIGNGAGISTGGNLTFTSSEGAVVNNHIWNNENGSVTLSGNASVTNNAIITSSNGIGMNSADGTIVNNAVLTAKGGAVSFEGKGNITNNALIEANGSVYIISTGGKVTNRAGIIAGKNFATTLAASPFSLRGRARAVDNGSVVISGSSGVINGANGSIQANDSVLLESSAGNISNSSSITATGGSVTISGNGSVNNSADITASGGSVEISGNGGIENTANIEASKDVSMTASAGSITNSGTTEVKATGGSVTISGSGDITGGTVTAGNGSVSMSGGGNITGGTVTADNGSVSMSGGGNITGGNVTGNDVILAGGSGSNVTASSITVDNSLQLQGDNITATNVERGNASGALNVSLSGAGGSNSTAQGDVNIKITSDVVFSNVNVSNANVEASGTMEVEKLHVEGKAGFVSSDTTVNVYGQGVTPDPNDTTAIQDKGDGNSGWLTLKIDDTGVQSTFVGEENKTDYPVQMSGKLVDYDPYDTYMEHYGDVADIFGRTDLVVADLIVANASPNGGTTQDGVVVLKQDDDGLRIEEEKKE